MKTLRFLHVEFLFDEILYIHQLYSKIKQTSE